MFRTISFSVGLITLQSTSKLLFLVFSSSVYAKLDFKLFGHNKIPFGITPSYVTP